MKETNPRREPLGGAPVPGPDARDEVDLFMLMRIIWRGKLWVLACACVALFLSGFYAFKVAVPKYQSVTELSLDLRSQRFVDIDSVVSGVSSDQSALNTELKVIKSRGLLGKLVDTLDLTDDPEFNTALRVEGPFSGAALKRKLKELLQLDPPKPDAASGAAVPYYDKARDTAIDTLREQIFTSNDRNTYVFQIKVRSQTRRKAALIANTLADLYIANQIAVKFDATEKAVAWLSDRVGELETEIERRENTLKTARAQTELISPEALEALNRQAKDVRERVSGARLRQSQAQSQLDTLLALVEQGDLPKIAQLMADPALDRLLARAASDTPGDAQALFGKRLDLLVTRAAGEVTRSDQQAQALAASLDKLEMQSSQQAADLVKIQQMERELNATRTLYETFLTRLKETTVQKGLQQADSHILSRAIPGEYVEPGKARILALSLILGAMAGIGFVLLRDRLHTAFRTPDELELTTGYSVLGQLPLIPIRKRSALIGYLNDKPTSAAVEAVRNLRTSVLLSNIDTPPQIILSTSSVPGEGKTTQAIALAQNFAGMGKKVLLIEGDIRRCTFSQYFDVQPKGGIVTALQGSAELHDVVLHDARIGCDVLMGEKAAVSAADLFSSETFRAFLDRARGVYDNVIIDTPPVLVVPDARIIAQYADAIIYAVAWDKTNRSQVVDGLKEFARVNRPVTGLVLSKINPRGMKRYGYGGKYGAYSRYGNAYYNAG